MTAVQPRRSEHQDNRPTKVSGPLRRHPEAEGLHLSDRTPPPNQIVIHKKGGPHEHTR